MDFMLQRRLAAPGGIPSNSVSFLHTYSVEFKYMLRFKIEEDEVED